MAKHDVVVIGAGPGGYVAAIRMGQLGLDAILVEMDRLGGVCLNWGCVPTKALYAATRLLARTAGTSEMGIEFGSPRVDLAKMASWKDGVVSRLAGGIEQLLEANRVSLVRGEARLDGPGRVALSGGERLEARSIVLATGSVPIEIPGFRFEHPSVWSSTDALALREIPERLLVIGAGVVGLELATIYRRLGSAVTVLEALPAILSGIDLDRRTVSTLQRALGFQGIAVHVNVAASGLEGDASGVRVRAGDDEIHEADRVLLAVGRRPHTADLNLESVGIEPNERGFIAVDEFLQTSAEGVFAIGDLVPGPMLAHKASAEGVRLAGHLAGTKAGVVSAETIPQAIFTDPEIASVGLSEARAKGQGIDVAVGRFPYAALGKALGMDETEGFFQVVADRESGRLLGAQIVGAEASDLIAEAGLAVHAGLTVEVLAEAVHAHPTLSEGLKEAAEHALGRSIHAVNRPRS